MPSLHETLVRIPGEHRDRMGYTGGGGDVLARGIVADVQTAARNRSRKAREISLKRAHVRQPRHRAIDPLPLFSTCALVYQDPCPGRGEALHQFTLEWAADSFGLVTADAKTNRYIRS